MECHDIQERFSGYLDGYLSGEEGTSFVAHLNKCPTCQEEWERFRKTVALIGSLGQLRAPEGFAAKVLERVDQRPWRRVVQKLFFPLHIKLPLEAFALLILALGGVLLYLRSPELQRAVQEPALQKAEAPSKARPEPPVPPQLFSEKKRPRPTAPGLMGLERAQPKDKPTEPLVGQRPLKEADSSPPAPESARQKTAEDLLKSREQLEAKEGLADRPTISQVEMMKGVPTKPSARAMQAPIHQEEQVPGAGPPLSAPKTVPPTEAVAPAPMIEAEARAPSMGGSAGERGIDVILTLKVIEVGRAEERLKGEIARLGGRPFEEAGRKVEGLRRDIRRSSFILPGEKYPALKEALKEAGEVVVERELLTEKMEEVIVQIELMGLTP